MQAVVL